MAAGGSAEGRLLRPPFLLTNWPFVFESSLGEKIRTTEGGGLFPRPRLSFAGRSAESGFTLGAGGRR